MVGRRSPRKQRPHGAAAPGAAMDNRRPTETKAQSKKDNSPRRRAPATALLLSAIAILSLAPHSSPGPAIPAVLPPLFAMQPPVGGGGAPTGLDFAVAGFPKTGTTFLLDMLERHPEVVMRSGEFCEIHQRDGGERVSAWLRNATSTAAASSGLPKKYGLKCPTMIRDTNAIENLAIMPMDTRLVVGVRHPVLWFQSFYNYRVQESYGQNRNETIPKPFELVNGTEWRGVTTAYARFDVYLRQLDKVSISPMELKEMLDNDMRPKRISKNPFKVFLYTVEQLRDEDTARQTQFQRDLEAFLGLKTPLVDFNVAPKSNVRGSTPHPEHMNICEPRYRGLRSQLVQRGRRTSRWILEKFINSPDVMVSDAEHFSSILSTWGRDPCGVTAGLVPTTASSNQFFGESPGEYQFPSVEQRFKYYLGDWYNRTNWEMADCSSLAHGPIMGKETITSLEELAQCSKSNITAHDLMAYCKDAHDTLRRAATVDNSTRALFHFGDKSNYPRLSMPVISKARLGMNTNAQVGKRPIIGLLTADRHYGDVMKYHNNYVLKDMEVPWEEKLPAVVWRGATTGKRVQQLTPWLDHDIDVVDFAFTSIPPYQRAALADQVVLRERMDLSEMSRYKYLLSVEGNDVATGLKWMLYSSSIVMMPNPTKATWAMEDMLLPWVHYIPLADDLSNLLEMLAWAEGHEEECLRISDRSTEFIAHLWVSEQARKDNERLKEMLATTYLDQFGAQLSRCEVGEAGSDE